MSISISDLWKRILDHSKKDWADEIKVLPHPATAKDITELEKAIGERLPTGLADLYRIHNGWGDLYLGQWALLSTSAVIDNIAMMKKLLQDGDFGNNHGKGGEGVRDDWWNIKWIPVLSDGRGNLMCLDYAPASGGKKGQLIDFDHEDEGRRFISADFSTMLSDLLEKEVEKTAEEEAKKNKPEEKKKPGWFGW